MKKLFLIASAAAAISGLSAFGQGYFVFSGAVRGVWDAWSGLTTRPSTNNLVAFLWGSGTPAVDAIMASTATNSAIPFDKAAAWNSILTDPNFHFALNNSDGSVAVAQSAANGAWQYPAGGLQTFPVTGTSPGAYQVFVIGWPVFYPTPAAAAAATAPVGWSAPFSYTATIQIGTPLSMPQSGLLPFAVLDTPEPSLLSLVGLGAGALLLRRKR